MPFWTYMLHCADRSFYVGHTDDLDLRIAQHEQGTFGGYTHERRPVKLVWCSEFPSRYEALSAERQIKGWSRVKKLALIRKDWEAIRRLAGNRGEKERASTSSARTGEGRASPNSARPEPAEGQAFFSGSASTRLALTPHPYSFCGALTGIEVTVSHATGRLALYYRASGSIDDLLIHAPAAPGRRDGLWQHTCFEAFVRAPTEAAYREFNFSPSGEWAAYRFTAYRSGMEEQGLVSPSIRTSMSHDHLGLEVLLELGAAAPLQLALSAVIEEKNGARSYWALAHPPGKPDFHHPACFALQLPPPARS